MTYIGDANDRATVLADADTFFSHSTWFADTDADEASNLAAQFNGHDAPPFWGTDMQVSGLVQVYDLVLPLEPATAEIYLSRLGAIAGALLANRDDIRGFPEDTFRGQVMPAWGFYTPDRDDRVCASRAGDAGPLPAIRGPGHRSDHGRTRNLRGVPPE